MYHHSQILVWTNITWLAESFLPDQLNEAFPCILTCNGFAAINHCCEWPSLLFVTVISWLQKWKGYIRLLKRHDRKCAFKLEIWIFHLTILHTVKTRGEGDVLALREAIVDSVHQMALLLGNNAAFHLWNEQADQRQKDSKSEISVIW